MTIALSEFWTRLVGSGITDADGCRQMANAFAQSNNGIPASDAVTLARFLAKRKTLSKYHARALLADPPPQLRFGEFLRVAEYALPPLSRWIPVCHCTDHRRGVIFILQPSDDSIPFLSLHQAIESPGLQPIELHQTEDLSQLVFSELADGQVLSQSIATTGKWSTADAGRLGITVAEALQSLHSQSLTHGGVRPDRIWVDHQGNAILLRDPATTSATPSASLPQPWLDALDSPTDFLAPEMDSECVDISVATDIYALGCLLFQLVTGQAPFDAPSADGMLLAHRSESPQELTDAIGRGTAGDPLLRVIAYMMAKNPSVRFQSAQQVVDALRAAVGLPFDVVPVDRSYVQDLPRKDTTSQSQARPSADSISLDAPARVSSSAASPLSIQPETRRTDQRRKSRKRTSLVPWVLAALCVPLLLAIIALLNANREVANAPVAEPRSATNKAAAIAEPAKRTPSPDTPIATADSQSFAIVNDDEVLWVPPYRIDTARMPLGFLPPGPGAIVSIRVAELRRTQSGQQVITAFSPELAELLKAVESRCKVPLDEIKRCTIALHRGRDGWPEVAMAIELVAPIATQTLVERWQVTASRTPSGASLYTGDDPESDAFFVSDEHSIERFAVGSIQQMQEVSENSGDEIPLSPMLEKLWSKTSDEPELIAIATPNFLVSDGRALLNATAPRLTPALKGLLLPDVAAMLVVADFDGDRFYGEVRLVPSGGVSEPQMMRLLHETTASWPSWAESFVVESLPDPSWRLLATRLPQMMRFVSDHTRVGAANGQAIANVYLPAKAVPQVVLGALLALNTSAGSARTTVNAGSPPALSIEQILDRKMSVSFAQESLEFAIDSIVDAVQASLPSGSTMPRIRIIGGDLRSRGITQNQQIRDFTQTDVPLRQVLTDLVQAANPDKTASGPDDPKQSLVWVVADDPEAPTKKAVLITTKEASAGKYELPREFVPTR